MESRRPTHQTSLHRLRLVPNLVDVRRGRLDLEDNVVQGQRPRVVHQTDSSLHRDDRADEKLSYRALHRDTKQSIQDSAEGGMGRSLFEEVLPQAWNGLDPNACVQHLGIFATIRLELLRQDWHSQSKHFALPTTQSRTLVECVDAWPNDHLSALEASKILFLSPQP